MTRPRQSDAELLLSVQLGQANIPFEREYRFAKERMGRNWRADFRIYWLLIEVEGGVYVGGRHTTGAGFEKDVTKYNAAAELGYVVLRYSTRMVNEGAALEQIRRILSKNLPNWRNAA